MSIAYNYDPNTGEYVGQSAMSESPLEPGVYLLPANATSTAPPAPGPKQAAVFADGAWSIVADRRGEVWWAGRGQPVQITELGAEPAPEWTEEEPPMSVRESILAQISSLEAQQTPRRIREAALTDDGRAWLEALDAQIAALRAQLGA